LDSRHKEFYQYEIHMELQPSNQLFPLGQLFGVDTKEVKILMYFYKSCS